MAWPNDARLTNFAAGTQVPSATLNEIQDEIINLYDYKWVDFCSTEHVVGGIWSLQSATRTMISSGSSNTDWISYLFPLREGDMISAIRIKHNYNTWTKTYLLQYDVAYKDMEYDSSTSNPASVSIDSDASSLAATGYHSEEFTFTEYEVTDQNLIFVTIYGADSGDSMHGCQLKVRRAGS